MTRTPVVEFLESRRLLALTAAAPLALDEAIDFPGAGRTAASVGGTLFYAVPESTGGSAASLWKFDGTASTRLEYFFRNTFTTPKLPILSNFAAAGGALYFTADTGSAFELWRSDGTAAGTRLQSTFTGTPATPGYRPEFTTVGSRFYYRDPRGYLRRDDGYLVSDAAGPGLLALGNALYYRSSSTVFRFTGPGTATAIANVTLNSPLAATDDGSIYFVGTANNVRSLYKSDGTAAGTRPVAPVTISGTSTTIAAAGNVVYFLGHDDTHGVELWASDGTAAGTGLLKDARPGPTDSTPSRMVALGGSLYFTNADSDTSGTQLWTSDGTAAGTVAIKTFPGGGIDANAELTVIGDALYFAARTPETGNELWTSDGTPGGTRLLADLYPGPASSRPHEFLYAGGAVHFQAVHPAAGYGLLKIDDGGNAATSVIHDYLAGPLNTSPTRYLDRAFLPDGRMIFGDGAGTHTGLELYVTDGTPGGTVLVKDLFPNAWTGSADARYYLTAAGDTVYFGARDAWRLGIELWKTDGTAAGTVLVKDIHYDPHAQGRSSDPSRFRYYNGFTYFTATDLEHGLELWKTDGTAAGTTLVEDFTPGYQSTGWNGMTVIGDTLYLFGSSGLFQITAASPTPTRVGGGAGDLFGFNGALYYTTDDGKNGVELWKRTGNTTTMVKDIWADPIPNTSPSGYESAQPYGFTQLGDVLLFSAHDGYHGRELWRTDGTAAGTYMVKDIDPTDGPGVYQWGSSPSGFTRLGGAVYFAASDDAGYALWRSDGTAAGTTLVKRLTARTSASYITAAGGLLYFAFDDGVHGKELWVSDGTPGGTRLYADINPGPGSSDPASLAVNRGALWFTANDGTAPKLFKIADTTAPDPAAAAAPDLRAPGVVLPFNEPVTLAAGTPGVQLINRATNQPLDPAAFRLAYDAALDRLTVRFTTPLPDGDYRLVLPAGTFTDAAGNPSTATTHDFFVLAADANHDRAVDFNDLTTLAQNYNKANKTSDQGDFNYDGTVDFADLAILAQRYNTTLAPPPLPVIAFTAAPADAASTGLAAESTDDAAPRSVFSTTPVRTTAPRARPPARR